jgi:N-acetylmuramoyl-L-alanine amidase
MSQNDQFFQNVLLSVGHTDKTQNNTMRGAHVGGHFEVLHVLNYIHYLYGILLDKGINTQILSHGAYQNRQIWANNNFDRNRTLYLECHLNAGGGRYPLVMHTDTAMPTTRKMAQAMAGSFDKILVPEECPGHYQAFSPAQVKTLKKGDRGYGNIKQTLMPALLLEPLFLDNAIHLKYIKEPYRLVNSIVEAILNFEG